MGAGPHRALIRPRPRAAGTVPDAAYDGLVDFSLEFTPDLIAVFLTLFVLEVVLGVDNVIFISILASKLPKEQQAKARNLGLTLAMVMRVILVLFAGWIITLKVSQKPLGRPSSCLVSSRWPVDETGINSVRPSTRPRMTAAIQSGTGDSIGRE